MTASLPAAVLAESDTGKGSPVGLFVVLLLIIAVYFLYRSMSGHLRRLPDKFPGYDGRTAAPPSDAAASAGQAGPGGSANSAPAADDGDQPGRPGPDGAPGRPA